MIVRKRGILLSLPIIAIGIMSSILLSYVAGVISSIVALFVLYFHRDPEITVEGGGMVSPCSGKVTDIRENDEYVEISIYLSLLNNHIIRSPKSGHIEDISRRGNGSKPAFLNSSEKNNRLIFKYTDVSVSVMTGFIARRLKPLVEESEVSAGDRICLISFGSRTNIRIHNTKRNSIDVEEGDRIKVGQNLLRP